MIQNRERRLAAERYAKRMVRWCSDAKLIQREVEAETGERLRVPQIAAWIGAWKRRHYASAKSVNSAWDFAASGG